MLKKLFTLPLVILGHLFGGRAKKTDSGNTNTSLVSDTNAVLVDKIFTEDPTKEHDERKYNLMLSENLYRTLKHTMSEHLNEELFIRLLEITTTSGTYQQYYELPIGRRYNVEVSILFHPIYHHMEGDVIVSAIYELSVMFCDRDAFSKVDRRQSFSVTLDASFIGGDTKIDAIRNELYTRIYPPDVHQRMIMACSQAMDKFEETIVGESNKIRSDNARSSDRPKVVQLNAVSRAAE